MVLRGASLVPPVVVRNPSGRRGCEQNVVATRERNTFCAIIRGSSSVFGYCSFGYQLVSQAGQLLRPFFPT